MEAPQENTPDVDVTNVYLADLVFINVADRISLSLESTPIVHEAFDSHRDYITHETLTLHVLESPNANVFLKSQKVNGEEATIGVEQVT